MILLKAKAMQRAIEKYPRKRISLKELYEMFEEIIVGTDIPLYSLEFENAFQQAIEWLVNHNIIRPIKSSSMNHHGLYLRYARCTPLIDNSEIQREIINNVKKPMDIKYYLSNPKDYVKDKEYIMVLLDFIKSEEKTWMTVNERSYQLFGDEKFLKGSERNRRRGETILKRLGLTHDDLYCFATLEPFFCFIKDDLSSKENRKVYVIENKDTFWSMKYAAFDGSNYEIDMLIYGEGRKIVSSFQFISEYGLNENDEFIYFGDLDPEGINIFYELTQIYDKYNFKPYIRGYEQLIDSAKLKGAALVPKDQNLRTASLDNFLKFFCDDTASYIENIILSGRYVPQEAFSLNKMKQLFKV